ncbi:unnamed protein product [Prorocentrum cordatum]|uniref:Uncharacterized protein n=1 Tax=Prorocentrum cordatum TaxID=2364126 RepID=A0ABN9QRZ4_9DINO|nr:unnamed protein product [Polarella glacialis]
MDPFLMPPGPHTRAQGPKPRETRRGRRDHAVGRLGSRRPRAANGRLSDRGRMAEAGAAAFAPPPGLEALGAWGLPLGLSPPPGLPLPPSMTRLADAAAATCAPPGLEEPALARAAAAPGCSAHGLPDEAGPHLELWPACFATISGLPNELLTDVMFEAILEQAGLSTLVVGFGLRPGRPCGEATVCLTDRMALERCAQHFQGCQWDPSGAQVAVATDVQGCQERELAVAAACAGGGCAFGLAAAAEAPACGSWPSALSCEAPAFVPLAGCGARAASSGEAKGIEVRKPAALVTSDTSTEVGESEAEDEHDSSRARALAAAWVAPQGGV